MDGDVAPLAALASIAKANDAALLVDEAHAFGCLGPSGRGLCAELGVQPDILIGTLGKALGGSGAFVAGTMQLRDYLLNHARSFIFTTAPPAPVAAAAHAALTILSSPEGDRIRHRLRHLVHRLRACLGLPHDPHSAPIIPLTIGADRPTLDASLYLQANGFFVHPIRPPTVREGTSRLRLTLSAHHTDQHLADLAQALASLPHLKHIQTPQTTKASAQVPAIQSPVVFSPSPPPYSKGVFILGTDTAVGKTSVAVAILHILARRGANPVPFKPVETGARPVPHDAVRLLSASMRRDIPLNVVCPMPFPDPVTPAAASGDTPITLPALLAFSRRAASYGGPLIVESAGGLLSPYAPNLTSADLASALGLPTLLVARNALGTINHTSLAAAELRRRSIPCLGTILVTTTREPTQDQQSNHSLIATATGLSPLGTLPFLNTQDPAAIAEALAANVDLAPLLGSLAI
jgi:dethiobiotin synthase